jgi:NAD(P)-dependent dehydrogenase (short-subunit alcohol dehydrogenase family)
MALAFSGPVPVPAAQSAGLTVLVTGAARGIGFELVQQYAQAHKDNVVIAAVRTASAAVVKSFSAHANVHVVQLDVNDEASIRASVPQVEKAVSRLDLLINNAGIIGEKDAADPVTVSAANFTSVFTTNVTGVLLTTQAYLPLLRKSSDPKVVNVSSGLGSNQLANVFGKVTLSYGLSKAALNYLTTAFRYAEPKVTFLSISPGWVATDMGKGAGPAPTSAFDSVQAIRYYIAEKGISNSGEFFDTITGQPIAF